MEGIRERSEREIEAVRREAEATIAERDEIARKLVRTLEQSAQSLQQQLHVQVERADRLAMEGHEAAGEARAELERLRESVAIEREELGRELRQMQQQLAAREGDLKARDQELRSKNKELRARENEVGHTVPDLSPALLCGLAGGWLSALITSRLPRSGLRRSQRSRQQSSVTRLSWTRFGKS